MSKKEQRELSKTFNRWARPVVMLGLLGAASLGLGACGSENARGEDDYNADMSEALSQTDKGCSDSNRKKIRALQEKFNKVDASGRIASGRERRAAFAKVDKQYKECMGVRPKKKPVYRNSKSHSGFKYWTVKTRWGNKTRYIYNKPHQHPTTCGISWGKHVHGNNGKGFVQHRHGKHIHRHRHKY